MAPILSDSGEEILHLHDVVDGLSCQRKQRKCFMQSLFAREDEKRKDRAESVNQQGVEDADAKRRGETQEAKNNRKP